VTKLNKNCHPYTNMRRYSKTLVTSKKYMRFSCQKILTTRD
jgi:hypothetical protein